MYQAIGAKRFMRFASLTFIGLALAGAFFGHAGGQGLMQALRTGWLVATIAIAIMFFLGQWPPAFEWACRATPLGRAFPPIGGVWRMKLNSNWGVIAERSGLEGGVSKPVEGTATIVTRLFAVSMKFEADSRYTQSQTVSVQVVRDPDHDDLRLAYIYGAATPTPVETDSGAHHGAGYVTYRPGTNGADTLEGHYWTNRNWTKGLNTAGTVTLLRPEVYEGPPTPRRAGTAPPAPC